jgi:hypothetical protein
MKNVRRLAISNLQRSESASKRWTIAGRRNDRSHGTNMSNLDLRPEHPAFGKQRPYAGVRAVLATMHGKEAAIAPVLFHRLGLVVDTAPALDTDVLGTFTGEIPRVGNIREAAIAKARLGMTATGSPIGIASEGSYGPHPHIPFMAAGVELMVLVDDTRSIVVSEHLVEDLPVYEHVFAESIDGSACSRDGKALIQTDMRAHMNATRMASLRRLASAFARRIATPCLACGMPGYGRVGTKIGLPCEDCGTPSIMARHQIYGCSTCEHSEKRPRPDGRTHAGPGCCPRCNP